jgi:hypothetical protein
MIPSLVTVKTTRDIYYKETSTIQQIYNWTMLGAQIYNSFCQRLLTIALCIMKTKTVDFQ